MSNPLTQFHVSVSVNDRSSQLNDNIIQLWRIAFERQTDANIALKNFSHVFWLTANDRIVSMCTIRPREVFEDDKYEYETQQCIQ